MIYHFTLPFPVSVNAMYNGGSKQQRFKSAKYKAWLKSCPPMRTLNLTNVTIHYNFYMPDDRSRDTCNLEKGVSDYLVSQGVLIDDSWQHIKQMTLTPMGIDRANPRVEIEIVT